MFEKFNLSRGAEIFLEKCYGVKPGMQVLVVTDTSNMIHTGEVFARAAQAAGAEVVVAIMSPRRCDGEPPPRIISSAMKGADLVVSVARYVVGGNNETREARALGTVFVTPISEGRDERIGEFNTTIDDLKKVKETNDKLIDFFKDKDEVRITSHAGSDLTLSVKARGWFNNLFYTATPLYAKEGWADFTKDFKFPDLLGYAEATCQPVIGSANGTYVVDDWMSGIGNFLLPEPITWKIKDGRVLEISGGKEAERLKELIQMKDENAINIGEFALGTNHIIKDPRGDHMDKAILGGMHLALGTSVAFGTHKDDVQSEMHCDGVSLNITVTVDGKTIMKDGKLLI